MAVNFYRVLAQDTVINRALVKVIRVVIITQQKMEDTPLDLVNFLDTLICNV